MNDTASLRRENKKRIRSVMRDGEEYTKQQLALRTGLSVSTCNTLLNEMEEEREVVSEKKKLQEVGRTSSVFRMNEAYENSLCIWFEIILGKRHLNTYLLSQLGTILGKSEEIFDRIDQIRIERTIRDVFEKNSNIVRIMIGTPSLVDGGVIRHCDIPELENVDLQGFLQKKFQVPVHMENDMHYRAYGYYKAKGRPDGVLTLANFPAHILPGTASIHKGELISGHSGLAGMVGFLPFEFDRKKETELLDEKNGLPIIIKAVVSVIAVINPQRIVFTGDLLAEGLLAQLESECKKFIPGEHMPEMCYEEDTNPYYLRGMYEKAMEIGGKW